ncbi:MAG: hexitol phosphatase HxpB [Candidatus Pseudobacter hemicellulosilyticus]|uniref:Hexitol phosphatase HxpB n=1 Tax=Candidatus Pseudobacter hemicellulosilyticus TaxID=3121375 RepID=A0AAJ6BFQ8_9BACT|nr:MAG: hexitol phosphatase HxpB [Pseudobacter sp.]
MKPTTVIFDMDGLLIDSEPYWEEAGKETLENFNISLTPHQYHSSTGLRTREWIHWWFSWFKVDLKHAVAAEETIISKAIEKIGAKALPMPGADTIFEFFKERDFKIGLATSSPHALVDVVADKLGIRHYLQATASAEELPYGKPHPQVYLNCAEALQASPLHCICFEDSFNGMIAAKAARMKCVVIPAPHHAQETKWDAADLKLNGLPDFTEAVLNSL